MYELIKTDNDWCIADIVSLLYPPDALVIPVENRARILAMVETSAPLFPVPSGQYPVEVVYVEDNGLEPMAGIRVKFRDVKTVRWRMANVPGGDEVYGADAGNLAIFDLTHLKKETLFSTWAAQNKTVAQCLTHSATVFLYAAQRMGIFISLRPIDNVNSTPLTDLSGVYSSAHNFGTRFA